MSVRQFDSGDVEPMQKSSENPLPFARPVWFDGGYSEMLRALSDEVFRLTHSDNMGSLADVVILVCTVEDGWDVCTELDKLNRSYICSFESREENEFVLKTCPRDKVEWRIPTVSI
jgi:hypothetical protein